MTTDTASPSERPVSRAQLATLRQRVALHDLAEMVVLRQRAVLAAAGAVVVIALLLTLVAPGVVPGGVVTGLVVGLLALAAGLAAAFVVHRQDRVLRSRMQARWDGLSVLAWVASLDDGREAEPVVLEMLGRVRSDRVHRRLFVEGGGDARGAAEVIAHEAAVAGRSVLLVDLTDVGDAVGIAGVAEEGVRLSDVVTFEPELQLARVGAGRRVDDAVEETVGQLERERSDLDLMLVVAPPELELRRPLLRAVDAATLVVSANARRRRSVEDAVRELSTSAETTDLLLVGGHLTAVDPIPPGMSRWSTSAAGTTDATDAEADDAETDEAGTSEDGTGRPAAPPPSAPVADARRPGVAPPSEPPDDLPATPDVTATDDETTGTTVDDARDPTVDAATSPDTVARAESDATADLDTGRDDRGFDPGPGGGSDPGTGTASVRDQDVDQWSGLPAGHDPGLGGGSETGHGTRPVGSLDAGHETDHDAGRGGSSADRPYRAQDVEATSDPAPGRRAAAGDGHGRHDRSAGEDVTEVIDLDRHLGQDDLVTSATLESLRVDTDDQA